MWNRLVTAETKGPHLIFHKWHDMSLKNDIAIKQVAEKIGHKYNYVCCCTCEQCKAAKKLNQKATLSVLRENKNYIKRGNQLI